MDNQLGRVPDNAARLSRSLRTVNQWNLELFQARSEPELLQSICRILVETAEVDLAWIGYCEDDAEKTVRPMASAGNGADYLERVHHSWGPALAGQGPVGEAIRTGHHCWVHDIRTDPIFSHARTEALALGYVSCVAFPLVAHTASGGLLDLRGALTLYARTDDTFHESDIGLYAELASYLACTISRLRRQSADDLSLGMRMLLKRGERKGLEEALQSSERRLRLITDTLPTLAWSALPDGSNAFVNQRWLEYTGISAEEAAGPGWQAAFHPEDIGKHTEKWRASLATGQPFENEARLRRAADGEYRWFLIHGAPLRDEPGNIVRWYGTATDIEDHKRTEQALRRSEAFLADAQKMSHTGSWAYDVASQRMIHSSEEYHRLFGFDPAASIPDPDEWVRRIHPDDRQRAIESMGQKVSEGIDYEVDFRTVHPDGTIKYVHGTAHPVLSPSGDLVEIVGSSIDVTERKRAEEARLDAQNKLAHANRVTTMGQLAASIAHEVNQPITGVVANARAALRFLGAQPADLTEVRHTLGEIVKDGNRAGGIIARIRALVKKMPPRKDRFDMNEAIVEVIALTRSEIVRNGISLKTHLAKELPSVHGDKIQLQQVLLNLIVNAVEAMSSESNRLRELLIVTSEHGSNGVRVAVNDSGPGVDQEAVEHLFDAFYTTKPSGMGMGLAICRSIIETHGGRIWATPNTPRGAVFQFHVPASEP
jgi:PAS domain S-box-containing protein